MNIVVALVFSLLFPGGGQIYNGEVVKGVGFGVFYIFVPLLLVFMSVNGYLGEWALFAASLSKGIVYLISIVDAGGRAYEIKSGKRSAKKVSWVVCLIYILVGIIINYFVMK